MKKFISILVSVVMLLSCLLAFNVAAEEGAATAQLKAKAYIITGNDNTVYVVFSHKVTAPGKLWVTDQNGAVYCNSDEADADNPVYAVPVGTSGLVYKYTSNIASVAEFAAFAKAGGLFFFHSGMGAPTADGAAITADAQYIMWTNQPAHDVYAVSYEEVASVDDVPTSYPEDTGNEGTGNEGTGNENTGNENTGNENTGNENTGNENTAPVVQPLAGKVYTVKGEPTKLYLVFNQKLAKSEGTQIVLGPAGILATDMTVVDDHIICFNQTSEFPLAILLKSGYNGTPQQCYIWDNKVEGQNGATLPMEDKVTVWGSEKSLYLFEYAGEVDSITELPAAAATGDNTVIAGVVVIAACALTLGLVAKKRKED